MNTATSTALVPRASIKTLREMAAAKGKSLYIENFAIGSPYLQKQLQPVSLAERVIDGKWEALAIIRRVPVTRYVLNLNDRIYPKDLWLVVQQNKAAEGTYCLSDHPENDLGSTGKIVGVWHNFTVGESMAYGDLYILDNEHGRTLLAAIKAGGKIGLSSVGFGEFLDDGKTINPQTYELVRLGDWVLDPSQQTFATLETSEVVADNDASATSQVNEQASQPSTRGDVAMMSEQTAQQTQQPASAVSITPQNENLTHKQENKMIEKIQESNFRNQVLTAVSRAKKGDNLIESRAELENFLAAMPAEGFNDLKTRVQEALSTVDLQLESTVKSQGDKVTVLEAENKELRGLLATAYSAFGKLKEGFTHRGNLIRALDKAIKEGKHPVVKALRSNLAISEANEADMKADLEAYEQDMQAMEADLDQYETDMQAMEADMEADKKGDEEKKEAVKKAQSIIGRQKRYIEALRNVVLSARNGKAIIEAIEAEINVDPTGGMDIPDNNEGASVPASLDAGTEDPNAAMADVPAGMRAYEGLAGDGANAQAYGFDQTDAVRDPSQQYAQPTPGTIGEGADPLMGDMSLEPTGGMDPALLPAGDEELGFEAAAETGGGMGPTDDPAAVQEQSLRTALTRYYSEQARLYPAVHDIRANILRATSVSSAVKMVETFLQSRSPAAGMLGNQRGGAAAPQGVRPAFMLEQNTGARPAWLKKSMR